VICEILVERHTALVRSCVRKAEIGGRLGISQMHVSRLLTRALDHLRARLIGESTDAV